MSKIDEVITLAKAGFKASEIREMLAPENREEETPKTAPAEGQAQQSEPEKEPEKQSTEEASVDYKALYEKAMSDLKIAQNNNNKQNVEPDVEKFDLSETIRKALG